MNIFISSPLSPAEDQQEYRLNIAEAENYCYETVKLGHFPLAPHTILTKCLDDRIPEERATVLRLSVDLLRTCDELWVFGERISDGMKAEIKLAAQFGLPIRWFKDCIPAKDGRADGLINYVMG